jgi:hypothetical protein
MPRSKHISVCSGTGGWSASSMRSISQPDRRHPNRGTQCATPPEAGSGNWTYLLPNQSSDSSRTSLLDTHHAHGTDMYRSNSSRHGPTCTRGSRLALLPRSRRARPTRQPTESHRSSKTSLKHISGPRSPCAMKTMSVSPSRDFKHQRALEWALRGR